MSPRVFIPFFAVFLVFAVPALSTASEKGEIFPTARAWHVSFGGDRLEPLPVSRLDLSFSAPPEAEQRPAAVEYSDFYNTRRKIHMIASWATIPMVIGESIAGQKLYDGTGSESAKSAHGAFTAGLAALFAVNTVTGVWNLWEGRHDPNGKTRRVVHSLLMLGADAGFVAAASLAPDSEDGSFTGDRSAHRNVAITSMSVAVASYIYMLVTR